MIILGIDPGSRITGFGIIQKKTNKSIHIENGCIATCQKDDFASRLGFIFSELQKIIRKFNPDAVAIENVFYSKNAASALKLGQARGVAIVAASSLQLNVFEYSPKQIKSSVTGFGGASKEQVQKMIRTLLNLPEIAEENASDALAAALCHAHTHQLNNLLQSAFK